MELLLLSLHCLWLCCYCCCYSPCSCCCFCRCWRCDVVVAVDIVADIARVCWFNYFFVLLLPVVVVAVVALVIVYSFFLYFCVCYLKVTGKIQIRHWEALGKYKHTTALSHTGIHTEPYTHSPHAAFQHCCRKPLLLLLLLPMKMMMLLLLPVVVTTHPSYAFLLLLKMSLWWFYCRLVFYRARCDRWCFGGKLMIAFVYECVAVLMPIILDRGIP